MNFKPKFIKALCYTSDVITVWYRLKVAVLIDGSVIQEGSNDKRIMSALYHSLTSAFNL